jgi:hypothetical protein
MFPRQRFNYKNEERCFERGPCRSVINGTKKKSTCSSVACGVTLTLTSCLLCRNLVTALYVLHYYFYNITFINKDREEFYENIIL